MSIGGRMFRAFRPSHCARLDELEEETPKEKQANIYVYSQRAQAGLPLFERSDSTQGLTGGRDFAVM